MADSSKERLAIASRAASEIEAIALMLQAISATDKCTFDILLPPNLRRLLDLAGVSLSVTGGDDDRTTEEMALIVDGD